jgi:putative addiction module component (TIGR02574 family)
MATYDDILGAAQHLPPSDRIRLVQALWEMVPPEDWPRPSNDWIHEVQRRSAEYDAGQSSASPWSEVRARARREAGLDE